MYFDFEDYRPDIAPIGRAISIREGVLLSIIVHLVFTLFMLFGPSFPQSSPTELQLRAAQLAREREKEARRFVFVAPRQDVEALKPKLRADDSDKNRVARDRERPPDPRNALPFARGNSTERVEAEPQRQVARGPDQAAAPPGMRDAGDRQPEPSSALPDSVTGPPIQSSPSSSARGNNGSVPGALGDALRNLQRYVQSESFNNPQGGTGEFGPELQFDTKGVEFGPWVRRFIEKVKMNWLVPKTAMWLKGHVVLTFYVHKDGTITDLTLVSPCDVDSFNRAAYNALAASNPVYPLPPEYPADRAFFTVTFFYNETPPSY
jgi:TonB family protein